MRNLSILLFLLLGLGLAHTAQGQSVNFEDGFEDGDFTNTPAWSGDTNDYGVVDDNPNHLLQLNASTSPAYLSTSSSEVVGRWEFYIEFRGFEPSGSNQANIFLMSDIADLEGAVNGYAIQVGESGDDVFHLVRFDSGSEASTVLSGTTIVQSGEGYTIRVDRDNSGNWQMQVAEGYGGSFNAAVSGTDNTYTSASYFGPKIDFTSSRSDLFYLDFKIDLPPFTLTDARLASATTVNVAFNRAADPATAEASDFTIDNGVGSPASISFPAPDTAQLSYSQPLPANKHTVSASGISDQSGNNMQPAEQTFYVFDSFANGDVKINEFMADPPSGQAEYVEVRNTSDKYLNLAQWKVGDETSKEPLASAPIPIGPDGMRVISADTTALFNTYGSRNYILLSGMPSLNNSGDAVQLVTADGTQADSLFYTSDWGGNNVALERRSPSAASIYSENWGDSPNPNGGTPGQANEVAADNTPPKLTALTIVSPQTLTLAYNERLNRPGSYSISNSSINSVNQTAYDTVTLTLGASLQDAQTYTLSISNAEDIFGNTIAPTDTSFTYYNPSPVDSGDVAINEFMSAPPSSSSEYVEIYNHSDKSLNLKNWSLSDDNTVRPSITTSKFVVPPDSFVVVTPDNSLETNYPKISMVVMGNFPSLNNGGDHIFLRDSTGTLLDSLTYSSTWGEEEIALERRSVNVAATYPSNWGDAPNGFGTPGSQNKIKTDTQAPTLELLTVRNSTKLALHFSENLQQSSAANPSNYILPNGPAISDATFVTPDSVYLTLSSKLKNAVDYNLEVENVADIFGNPISQQTSTFTYYEISPVDSGDVAINEFMSAPPSNSSEYVEIYNHSDKSLDLQNWTLSDNRGTSNRIAQSQVVVPPDSFIVITPDNSLESVYPDINMVIMGDFPSLNNGGDQIILRDGSGALLDSLAYNSDWGKDEIALERRSVDVNALYQNNWEMAPNGFGTPGRRNEAKPDSQPPLLSTFSIQSSSELALTFSEPIDRSTATRTANYTLPNGPGIADARFIAPDSLFLDLDTPLQNAIRYSLTVENVSDLFGNAIAPADTSFTYYQISLADSGNVFVNEFSFEPPSGQTEYIELYNPTDKSFDLQQWTLSDNRDSRYPITQSQFIVPPDSFVVIAPDNTLLYSHPDILLVPMNTFPSLNNSGDEIALRNADGTLLDSLAYASEWGDGEAALERRTTTVSGTYQSNWGPSPNGTGTPGIQNEVPQDTQPPELAELSIRNSTQIMLRFSEQLDQASATAPGNYVLSNSPGIADVKFSAPDSVFLTLTDNLQNATDYTLAAENIADIFGNAIAGADTTFSFYEVSPVDSGHVFINEFSYDPPSGQTEYIELYNPTKKSFDLQGWSLSDNRGTPSPVTQSQFIIPPDSFVVIAPDNTLLSSYPDISLLAMSDFPSLNNSSDAIILRQPDGSLLDSLQYSSAWGGNEIPLERRTTETASIYKENWGPTPNGKGSPGRSNQIEADQTPPQLVDFKILNNRHLNLIFDERIAPSSIHSSVLSISGDISIDNASLLPPDTISVALSSELKNASDYTIGAQNIGDIFGNQLASADTSFTFYQVSPVDSGDVFINEFSYDPPSGSTEYVEIYNTTAQSFDLQDWTLSDNRGNRSLITNSQYIVPPDSFVVIAPDNTLLTDHPNIALVTMSNFPALNGSGDDIVVRGPAGSLLDSLRYTSDWGGNDVALERRTTGVSGTFSQNWGNAPNGFGTPGTANEIKIDDTPPFFAYLNALDGTTLQLIFSEQITASSATNREHYSITPSRDIQLISARGDSVTLYLASELTSGDTYKVTASNIEDIFGNTLSGATKEFTYLKIDAAHAGDIVINEILYNPADAGPTDYVELYNTTDKNFEIGNWQIADASSTASIPENTRLPAKSYLVLSGDDRFVSTLNNGIDVADFPSYNNNSGDDVLLRTDDGRTIDSLHYEPAWGGSKEGSSLERQDPLAASNDASNWQTSNDRSAGHQNITFQEDTSPPQVTFSKVLPNDHIEVRFNEFIRLTQDLKFFAGDQRLQIASFDSTRGNVIFLASGSPKSAAASSSTITVKNLSDVRGNTVQSTEIAVAQPLAPADLVINEIMFNPLNDSDDNQPDQSEYIELRNTRDYAISLEGLYLHDAPDEDGGVRRLSPVVSTAKWVPAQGVVLIHADPASSFDESNVANFFDLAPSNPQSIMRIDRSSLSLASSGDAIYIADSSGTTIDSVFYSENWHNPNLIDTRGVALERVAPRGPSNDEANWGSSVNPKGGTPNKENSIYQENTQQPQQTGISFQPNPFSPDGDGYEDKLFINYKLDQPDYLIDVHIYDRYGRMVRELADGQQAGLEGQLIWDGRKDDGGRNRIGIYIVVFEAYDSASGKNKSFKKTVVLARKLN